MDYEEDTFKHRIDETTDESLATTHRIRQVAEETNQIGTSTMGTLHDQGEQLNYIEYQVDKIEVDLKEADEHLHEIEKCCGCCVCPWNRVSSTTTKVKAKKKSYSGSSKDPQVIKDQPRHTSNSREKPIAGGGYVKRVTHDDRENEMDENLKAVGGILGNLKGIAKDMGTELDRQNKQIDRLNEKVQAQDDRLKPINERIRQQL